MNKEISELVKALELIQDTCSNNQRCENCMLGTSGGECCVTINEPSAWDISEPTLRIMS